MTSPGGNCHRHSSKVLYTRNSVVAISYLEKRDKNRNPLWVFISWIWQTSAQSASKQREMGSQCSWKRSVCTLMRDVSDDGTWNEASDSCESAQDRSRIKATRLNWSSPSRTIISSTIVSTSFSNCCPTWYFFVDVEFFRGSVVILTPKLTRSTS